MAKSRKRLPTLSRLLAKRKLKVVLKNYLSWNRRKLSAYVFLSLLLLAYFWPRPTFSELVVRGDAAFSSEAWTEAYRNYVSALGIKPNDFSLRLKLAGVYEASGNYALAVEEILKIKSAIPETNLEEELRELVELRDQPARLRSDLQKTESVLDEYPDFRDAWLRSAYLNYLLREDVAAKKALDRALELDPNNEAALKLRPLLP